MIREPEWISLYKLKYKTVKTTTAGGWVVKLFITSRHSLTFFLFSQLIWLKLIRIIDCMHCIFNKDNYQIQRKSNKWNNSSFTSELKSFTAMDDGQLTSDLIGEVVWMGRKWVSEFPGWITGACLELLQIKHLWAIPPLIISFSGQKGKVHLAVQTKRRKITITVINFLNIYKISLHEKVVSCYLKKFLTV